VRRIVDASASLIDIPVETVRTDAVQSFLKQETVFVTLKTDDGATGVGYAYTIGTGGTAVLAMLRGYLLDALIGEDATRVEGLWRMLFARTRATTVGAVTSLALAAVDTALWDLRCRRAAVAPCRGLPARGAAV
jgi:L-alanine-DL-glutamate epimerase-like enolase superfamily enzyme